MNATTISSHVINTTSSTMQNDNPSLDGDENSVGAYTAVLAITVHIVAMIFGGGKSVAVVTAIYTKGNINKYSYLLVLTLLLACCCVNFIFSPLEIGDLLTYHYNHRHPSSDYLAAKTSLYIFLFVVISTVIVLITLEAIFRQGNWFGHILKKIWPLTTCVFALVWSAILTAVLISKLADSLQSSSSPSSSSSSSDSTKNYIHSSYVIVDDQSQTTFLIIAILMISLVLLVVVVLLIQFLKSHVYWEGGFPHVHKKKMSLAMPEFLISQSQNDCEEEYTGGYDNVNEPSTSRSPSPSTPKLLMVSSPDSIKGGEGMPQPQTTPKSGNRLGINMAQVLGRRRHTICQISDSSTTPAPPDPISKAKQYNYVRKFSVDISALQAQLQNPKIFKEAPFQSDIDLAKRAGEGDKNNRTQKPLQPLQPLNLKLKESKPTPPTVETPSTPEVKVETPQSAGLSVPPPVIMVSNDDAIPEKEDNSVNNDEKENGSCDKSTENTIGDSLKNDCNHDNTNSNNVNTTGRPEIPTSLSLKGGNNAQIIKNEIANNDVIVKSPTLDSSPDATSNSPNDNSNPKGDNNGKKLARLSSGMCIIFLLTMIPVMLVVAVRDSTSANTFVSVYTCIIAISTALQTIAYPHLIACCDGVVRGAVRKMNARVKRICLVYFCRRDVDDNSDDVDDEDYGGGCHRPHNIDDNSSTSHV